MADVYQLVTDKITAALEAGTVPWHKPWAARGGMPRNLVTRRPYRGMNLLLLSLGQPYQSPYWLTFKQAKDLGGSVRKGEKSSLVTFWKLNDYRERQDEDGSTAAEVRERRAPILRYYLVFNAEQCEGIPVPPLGGPPPREHERIAACEALVAGMRQRPEIRTDPRQAFYNPALDFIGMPDLGQFETAESYYATLFHELTHSTGHASRLNRPTLAQAPAPFGSPDYSREELVAEFGAAFLCGHAGIFPRVADNSAAYIDDWLRVLKGDRKLLPVAAAQAQRAADFILGAAPGPEAEAE